MKHTSPSSVGHPLLTIRQDNILANLLRNSCNMHSQYTACLCMVLNTITIHTPRTTSITGGHHTPNLKITIQITYRNTLNNTCSLHTGSHIHIQLHPNNNYLHTTMHNTPVHTLWRLP
jgi:hypothetical protein